ncbi:MAG: trimeric intracellular cation channel family protein [Burkholderiaceae bacterium]
MIAEGAATAAFAISGVIEAARKRMDAVGICVVGALAAFGGGTLRDLLLQRRPFFWVQHVGWIWFVLALCVGAMFIMRARHVAPTERAMQWPDAIGLGLFTATGTQISLEAGSPALVAVIFGMMTAVFGGVLRDIVCNEIPRAFSDHRPYAICAFIGGWVLVLLSHLDIPMSAALLAAATLTTALRVLAIALDWRLPAWRAD